MSIFICLCSTLCGNDLLGYSNRLHYFYMNVDSILLKSHTCINLSWIFKGNWQAVFQIFQNHRLQSLELCIAPVCLFYLKQTTQSVMLGTSIQHKYGKYVSVKKKISAVVYNNHNN